MQALVGSLRVTMHIQLPSSDAPLDLSPFAFSVPAAHSALSLQHLPPSLSALLTLAPTIEETESKDREAAETEREKRVIARQVAAPIQDGYV